MQYKEDFVNELVTFYKRNLEALRAVHLSKNVEGITHSQIISYATYAPWKDDLTFSQAYNAIKNNTLVDIYRCYELFSWILRHPHIEGDILEVGVWKGGTGCLLGLALKEVSVAGKVFLVDTFTGVVKPGIHDPVYKGGEHADTSKETVMELIAKTSLQNIEVFEGIYPEAVHLPDPIKLRLCHIDVDTYQSAKDIFIHVWPYINKGGCVVFDDYGFWGCEGITTLCNELALSDAVFFYNLNGHAIFVKL